MQDMIYEILETKYTQKKSLDANYMCEILVGLTGGPVFL